MFSPGFVCLFLFRRVTGLKVFHLPICTKVSFLNERERVTNVEEQTSTHSFFSNPQFDVSLSFGEELVHVDSFEITFVVELVQATLQSTRE